MAGAIASLSICLIMSFILLGIQHKRIINLKNDADTYYKGQLRLYEILEEYKRAYTRELLKGKGETKIVREVPKGTVQAVKMAMKMSHPDNGGKEVDFIMYRRAYNILTGKEKP